MAVTGNIGRKYPSDHEGTKEQLPAIVIIIPNLCCCKNS